jgi:hypothetical protein
MFILTWTQRTVLLVVISRSLPGGHMRGFMAGSYFFTWSQRTVLLVLIHRSLQGSNLEPEDSPAGINPQISSRF